MTDSVDKLTRLTAWVHGHVQGVGFRWWVRTQIGELGLAGSATNYSDGRVLVVAEGPVAKVETLKVRLEEQPTRHRRPGHVATVVFSYGTTKGVTGFEER